MSATKYDKTGGSKTTHEKIARNLKKYMALIITFACLSVLFCVLYVSCHTRHHVMRGKYRALKKKHKHLEFKHGRVSFVYDKDDDDATPTRDERGALENNAQAFVSDAKPKPADDDSDALAQQAQLLESITLFNDDDAADLKKRADADAPAQSARI